ncbi:MAG TPA: HD family phosphohydrolase [Bacilli bacterium]|nr:HD family phosphohydrolase [Bacilli bacterium]
MARRKPIDQMRWWKRLKEQKYIRVILYILLGFMMYFVMLDNVLPEKLNIRLSSVAEHDIRSPMTVENKAATEQKRQEAVEAISPVFVQKKEYAQHQVEKANDIFDLIAQVNHENEQASEGTGAIKQTEAEKLAYVKEVLSSGTSNHLSDETLLSLLQASNEQLQIAKETTANVVYEVMTKRISLSDLEAAKESIAEKITISTVSNRLKNAMIEIARFTIIPNFIYDDKATERLRQEAREAIEPVIIREGQLLVKENEIINHELYEQLRMVGLLDDSFNILPYIGLAIFVALLVGLITYYIKETKTSVETNNSHLLMFVAIFFVTLSMMKISSLLELIGVTAVELVVPVAVGSMLLTLLIHQRIALFSSVIFAIIGSVIFNNETAGLFNFTEGIYLLFSSIAAVYYLGKSTRMTRILQAGLFVSVMNMVLTSAILLMKTVQYSAIEFGLYLGFSFASGFLAAVLTLGLLPFFEAGFSILSTAKLIELSSPNHPLFRKLLIEAPGTYHHSVMVANLAEAACEAVGANGLLARVGAYYHDIGKTKRPHFFIENQMKIDNPHDKISPQLSATIIISHPYDGAEMLKEHKMPKEIIDIAEQHHGTTLLKYFYHQACKESDKEIHESQFRYPGPKAQFKEAAIVGFADSVEAAVRSMQKPNPDKIEALVRKILTDRLEDGQFDECDLTLRDLDKIANTILETLQGTFHSRIEYPEDIKERGAK